MLDTEIQALDVTSYLETSQTTAARTADLHYAALWKVFLDTVPACFRRTGEFAPEPTRPMGFTSDSTGFQFGLDFGAGYAATYALFRFKKKRNNWTFQNFVSQVFLQPFTAEQAHTKTLQNAVLAARELWLQQQKLKQASGEVAPEDSVTVQ